MPCDNTHLEPVDLFCCTNCGDCCQGYGGTYVNTSDIAAIAAFLKMGLEDFKAACCQISGRRLVLAQSENGYCRFWSRDQGCRIHPVKPRMCREWPFIAGVAAEPHNWELMAGVCPGMRPGIEPAVIQRLVQQVRNPKPH